MNLDAWLTALDQRHLADLTPSEVTRALRALSSCYVERREKLARGGALDGAGKRAAFALFYGPQHFLVTQQVVRALETDHQTRRIIDLGCGTGTAGAAIAVEFAGAHLEGFDLNPWAVTEANWMYRTLGLPGRARIANLEKLKITGAPGTLVLAAYTVNELAENARDPLLAQLRDAHARGASVLVIEPIGRRVNLWWKKWADVFVAAGGRDDEWRFRVPLPQRQQALATGAGLDVQELTARSLYLPREPTGKADLSE